MYWDILETKTGMQGIHYLDFVGRSRDKGKQNITSELVICPKKIQIDSEWTTHETKYNCVPF